MFVRPDGTTSSLTSSRGACDEDCAETKYGQDVVLSYSDDSVKDPGFRNHRVRCLARKRVLTRLLAQGIPRDP